MLSPERISSNRGAALLTVLIFTAILALITASLIRYALAENRLNHRSRLLAESRYLAESVVDYGFAQMAARFERQRVLPEDEFQRRPLILPRESFHAKSNADPSYFEIVGGTIPQTVSFDYIDPTDPNNGRDPLIGQMVFTREIYVYGRAAVVDRLNGSLVRSYTSQRLQVRDAPLFGNAIFYNVDLEFSPGAPMSIHGTVHSNRDLYLITDSTLHFLSKLTSARKLFHGGQPGGGKEVNPAGSKALNIKIDRPPGADGKIVSREMWADGAVVDSRATDYRSVSEDRWARRVQTQEHNMQEQRPIALPPMSDVDDPATPRVKENNPAHAMIAPAQPLDEHSTAQDRAIEEQRFANQAGLRIAVDAQTKQVVAYARELDTYGNPVKDDYGNVKETQVTLPAGLVQTDARMHDARRNNNIGDNNNRLYMADVDVAKLKQVIENPGTDPNSRITGYDPAANWNGIVYIQSTNTDQTGVRLINGQSLPDPNRTASVTPGGARGMTVATNSPLYIKGNYNADGTINTNSSRFPDSASEPPAAVIADAVTILSNAWNDANSGKTMSSGRVASNTEVAAAILTGIVRSQGGNYSGGVENFPRFLENWSGKTVAIRGSMVCLFYSEVANQAWRNTGDGNKVYNAPTRSWGFNELFRTLQPPGTPNTRTTRRIHYRTLTAAQYEQEVGGLRP
jgi:hypothetical protein